MEDETQDRVVEVFFHRICQFREDLPHPLITFDLGQVFSFFGPFQQYLPGGPVTAYFSVRKPFRLILKGPEPHGSIVDLYSGSVSLRIPQIKGRERVYIAGR